MRKNHSKIVCIKLVHLPYFIRKVRGSNPSHVSHDTRLNYNVVCCLVCHIKTRKRAENVREWSFEEDIWT